MNSMNFIIASEKKWNKNLVGKLNQDTPFTWESINKKEDLSIDHLKKIIHSFPTLGPAAGTAIDLRVLQ